MYPVGFYDLRDAATLGGAGRQHGVPSRRGRRAWRATRSACSRRCWSPTTAGSSRPTCRNVWTRSLRAARCSRRSCSRLAHRATATGGLVDDDALRFLDAGDRRVRAVRAKPVDRAWYAELEAVSAVAADIGGVSYDAHQPPDATRARHRRPVCRGCPRAGIAMIDAIQGPPRWDGPDVLLRQTSFRALAEQRQFRAADGTVAPGSLRVRFGEVEARGIALTPSGRDRYDAMLAEVDRRMSGQPATSRPEVAADVWRREPAATPSSACCGTGSASSPSRPARSSTAVRPVTLARGNAAGGTGQHGQVGGPRRDRRAHRHADRLRGLPAAVGRGHLSVEPGRPTVPRTSVARARSATPVGCRTSSVATSATRPTCTPPSNVSRWTRPPRSWACRCRSDRLCGSPRNVVRGRSHHGRHGYPIVSPRRCRRVLASRVGDVRVRPAQRRVLVGRGHAARVLPRRRVRVAGRRGVAPGSERRNGGRARRR